MGSTEAGRNASLHKTHPGDNVPFRETAGASAGYGDRSFGKEADEQLKVLVEKARGKQAELKKQGTESEVLREEPFTIARDSLGFKVYLMKWNKGRKDCTVEIEEM